jgi:hypothetical protein
MQKFQGDLTKNWIEAIADNVIKEQSNSQKN